MNTSALSTVQPAIGIAETAPVPIGNIVGALALVVVLIVAVAWIYRRAGGTTRMAKGNTFFTIKHTQSLGTKERLVVLEIDGEWLLLGVTQENITHLMTMEKRPEVESENKMSLTSGFQTVLMNCITQRKGEGK